MSQFFDTFLKDVDATPYRKPDTLPEQPDIMDDYRIQVNMYGDVRAHGKSNNLTTTLAPSGVKEGVYTRMRVNAKGLVVEGLSDGDIDYTSVQWNKILNRPTTRSGYGLTDVYSKTEVDILVADAVEGVISPIVVRNYNFPRSLQWRVKHNMMTVNIQPTIRNQAGDTIYANIRIVDNTEFLVEFTTAESGTLNVVYCLTP